MKRRPIVRGLRRRVDYQDGVATVFCEDVFDLRPLTNIKVTMTVRCVVSLKESLGVLS